MDVFDDSSYKSKKSRKVGSKHGVEGMAYDSFVNHHGHSGGKIASKQTVSWLNEEEDLSPNIVQRSSYSKFKPPVSARNHFEAPDMEERRISVMMTQVFNLYVSLYM